MSIFHPLKCSLLPATPPPSPGTLGSIGQNLTFFRTWTCCIKLNGIMNAVTGTKYYARRPPLPHHSSSSPPIFGVGLKSLNSAFSEHGHVAYQIKGNHKCSPQIFYPQTPPPFTDPRGRVKSQNSIFSE